MQLVTTGAGTPSLGEYKSMDKKTGKMNFELEQNNCYDAEGNSLQTKGTYFTDGWVEEPKKDKKKGSGWFS